MKHTETTYIDEYLRGELHRAQAERVAAHLKRCPQCRAFADWLGQLNRLAAQVRIEPSEPVVEELHRRLLGLPEQLATGEVIARPAPKPRQQLYRMSLWSRAPSPLLRVAAILLIGVFIGYGIWGRPARREPAIGTIEVAESESPELARPVADMASAPAEPATGQQEARIEELERALLATYFAKVEAAMLHFVTGAAEGELAPLAPETTQNMLSLTARLKADCKASRDMRMIRLFGQIESVLMEMDHLSRERDLQGARHVASIIEEEGLLYTLQRFKVSLEE